MKITFEVNGTDLSALCSRRGYTSTRVPVYSKTVTTLDGAEHARVLRWRNSVTVTLNDLTDAEVAAFCAAVSGEDLTVKFYSAQLERVVTNVMRLSAKGVTSPFLLQHRGVRYWSGRTVQFTEV